MLEHLDASILLYLFLQAFLNFLIPYLLEPERMKVREVEKIGDYMSIAINKDREPVRRDFIPWKNTATAFNMRTPKITLAADDIQVSEIMRDLNNCKLKGLYIFSPLEKYDFVSEFTSLQDLFICKGQNIWSLSFIRRLPELFMLYHCSMKREDKKCIM